jgi:glycerophosphoryl diester phosphodiesterase
VNVWVVDDPGTLAFWRDMGVDKICTNRPGAMLEHSAAM